MAMYQSPEDEAVFKGILQRDPESQKCFECNYPNAPWCDINHGIFVCLDCSGVHRGLGVHLSFVRSSSMDGWSNWRPEKLKQMEIGGNARARKFFEAKGVPKAPIRARYEHVGALMYKDMLEAEVAGRPFNERTWQPPDWAVPKPPGAQQQGRPGSAAASNDRFRGQGSQPAKAASSSTSTTDWLGALSSGISTVATQATVIASTAATVTVQSSQQLASKIQQQAGNPDDLTKKAQETAAVATQAVSSAWGALSSWTSSAVSSLAAVTTGGSASSNRADEDDDGLGGLTRNLKTEAPAPDPRFRGVEHRAERQSELSGLTSGLSRTGKYEGIGGDETPTQPATAVSSAPPRQASSGNIGSRQTSQNNFATSPVARQTATASPPVAKPATSTSPVPASAASPTGSQGKQQEEKKTTSAVPAEWGWDDE